jgi:hypothetical protein
MHQVQALNASDCRDEIVAQLLSIQRTISQVFSLDRRRIRRRCYAGDLVERVRTLASFSRESGPDTVAQISSMTTSPITRT